MQNYSIPVQSWVLYTSGLLGRSVVPFKASPPRDILSLDLEIPNSIPEMKMPLAQHRLYGSDSSILHSVPKIL